MNESELKTTSLTDAAAAPSPTTTPAAAPSPVSRTRRFWREQIRPIVIVVVALFSFRSAVADWNDVPTPSMEPTILVGDRIFVNKLAYDLKVPFTRWRIAEWSGPKRGEIVVFFSPVDETRLVKRVVGIPGEVVEVHGHQVLINGVALSYSDGRGPVAANRIGRSTVTEDLLGVEHPVQWTGRAPAGRDFGPLTIPTGQYFVMGDNRDNSADSRVIGCIDRERIVGRSSAVVLSVDPAQHHRPRWDRFLHPLP